MYGGIGCCRRNLNPPRLRFFNCSQSRNSVSVDDCRSLRANFSTPPPPPLPPPPARGEIKTHSPTPGKRGEGERNEIHALPLTQCTPSPRKRGEGENQRQSLMANR